MPATWPDLWGSLDTAHHTPWLPLMRLALPTALVLTAAPHLAKPVRRLAHWSVLLAAVAAVPWGLATPTGAVAALVLAVAAAGLVHLALGSCQGRPSLDEVAVALDALGVSTRHLGAADRQTTGLFVVDAVEADGSALVVKVYGRDAQDTQLVRGLWRTLWFRQPGSPPWSGRRQQVEHEGFVTLLAQQSGVTADRVVTAGSAGFGDALLVLAPAGRSLAATPSAWSRPVAEQAWALLALAHQAGIGHGQLDDQHLLLVDAGLSLADFRGAVVPVSPERRRRDEAQLLVTTALALGAEVAVEVARAARGVDGLTALLAYVQLPALTPHQRDQRKQADLDLAALRQVAADQAGVEAPQLERLHRVTARSVIQVVLLLVAFFALANAFAGLDLDQLRSQLATAVWWLVVAGFGVAQLTRFAQAFSLMGASPEPLPMRPVYFLQLAQSYLGLAVPSSAARIAVSVRFFQRSGLTTGSALAVGALDGFAGFVVQVVLLVSILVLTPATLELELDGSTPAAGLVRLMAVIVGLGLAAIVVLLAVGPWRRRILGRLRVLVGEALEAIRGLGSPRRLALLFGGNAASEVLFALSLGAFTAALGYPLSLVELLLINLTVSLLAGFLPIPGGIGVMEGGLTLALARAGLPEETAFGAVIMYRLSTYYLPPIWGFFSLRWLERNQYL